MFFYYKLSTVQIPKGAQKYVLMLAINIGYGCLNILQLFEHFKVQIYASVENLTLALIPQIRHRFSRIYFCRLATQGELCHNVHFLLS